MFIKTTFKYSKRIGGFKRIGNYGLKRNLYLYFLNITKIADF